MKKHVLLTLTLGLVFSMPVNAKWQRIPTNQDRPIPVGGKGLRSEASILNSSGIGKAESLLSIDPADTVSIAAGNSSVVISFKNPTVVNRTSFVNDGIEGRATLSGSADNKGWAALDEKVFTASDREILFSFAGMQMRFLKVEFALSKAGTIRSFVMFGSERDKDYTVRQTVGDPKKAYPVNFTGVGGTRIVFASPKPANSIDDASAYNKFSFPESDEKYRTLIYDLGQLRVLDSFGSVHSPRPVRFEVFTFAKLPQKEDWRGRLTFNPAEFNLKDPVAAGEDTRGLGYLKVKPKKPVGARYVALRWEPDFNPPAFDTSGTQVSGPSQAPASAFSAAGVPPGGGSGGGAGGAGGGGGGGGDSGGGGGVSSTPDAGGPGSGAPIGGGADGAGGSAPAGTSAAGGGISNGSGGTQPGTGGGGAGGGGGEAGGGNGGDAGGGSGGDAGGGGGGGNVPFQGSPSVSGVGITNTPGSP